jgi:tetratricopeptide (TPR) repeat protein
MKHVVSIVFLLSLAVLTTRSLYGQTVSAPVENPETLVNLARLDASAGRLDRAISNYERSLALIDGPLPPGVDGATVTQWRSLEPVAKLNLGLLYAAKGADFFQANSLEDAIASFRTSLEWNPFSRDIRYNLCQAMYIHASRLKDQGTPNSELAPLYRDIVTEATTVRVADPANLNLGRILAYSHRNLGDEANAAEVFAENDSLALEVNDVRMDVGATTARVSGVLKNLKLAPADPVRMRIALLGLSGATIAESDVDVSAPPVNQGATFALDIPTKDEVAGWRYQILNAASAPAR